MHATKMCFMITWCPVDQEVRYHIISKQDKRERNKKMYNIRLDGRIKVWAQNSRFH